MAAIRKKVRWYVKRRKGKRRKWKESWVTIHTPDKPAKG